MTAEFRANAYAYALLSVADLTTALDLWAGRFGMQIVARPFDDLRVFRAATAFEAAKPWRNKHPAL